MNDITPNTPANGGQILTDERIEELIRKCTRSAPRNDGDGVYYADVFAKREFARAIEAEQAAKIADLKRTIEWYQGRTGIMMGEAARAGIAGAASAEQADDITCDQCIELEGELHREYARQAIAGTRTAASLLNEGAFRAGMETACDELETRLKLDPDPKSEVPTTRDDMWCALLAATDAYLNSDPDPVIMILRGDKQTWLALGTKAQITMMCDGRSGAQMERDAAAALAPAAPLPEQTGPSLTDEWISENLHSFFSYGGNKDNVMWACTDDIHFFARAVEKQALAASPSPAPAKPLWLSVDFIIPEPGVEVLIDGHEGVEVAHYSEVEPDQTDQMGHDAGWWGYKFAACGRSFGAKDYLREAQGQPKYWMPLPDAPSDDDDENSSEATATVPSAK